ncbi:hypothetical protein [Cupriavidus basilensis]|uniref:hypothetical protein n=1 Tax=Cupriavidus basilensis TaxID=68895 RepID=UPI001F50B473|nr:hypothetical protein [Cupriavidus basilensis]
MTLTITLQLEAKALAANLDGTPDALLALTHAGYRCWTKARRLHFPPPRREALLLEIMRFCADTNLLECPPDPEDGDRLQAIEGMLDGRYPRYARLKRNPHRA